MRVTLAQQNPIVGDIDGNASRIARSIEQAKRDRSDLVVTSELAVVGYPPRDLVLREGFSQRSLAAVRELATRCTGVAALIGFLEPVEAGTRPARNSVALCRNGRIEAIYAKRLLPTYDVFDEDRYFVPGESALVVEVAGERVGVLVCEDLWRSLDASAVEGHVRHYASDPLDECLAAGATTVAVLSASPFVVGKDRRHHRRLAELAARGLGVIAVNQAGGNDDLVFDGRSRVIAAGGATVVRAGAFVEEAVTAELSAPGDRGAADEPDAPEPEVFAALVVGIRDYFAKTGHTVGIIGLSGGIDSALVGALAARALGPANLIGVFMPSRYSSGHSLADGQDSARRLGLVRTHTIPIESAHQALRATVATAIPEVTGVTDENLQSRLRSLIVMSIANATGGMVLSTGNKSELAAGYATLYGDMSGGVAPLGDLVKSRVYALARWANAHFAECGFATPPIPQSSIDKPPSAELRPDQTDQDTLPPYDVLDAIVEGWVEREESVERIAERTGIARDVVARWCATIDRMQYKRAQAAVVLKVTARTFGRGRVMPLAGRPGF